MVTELLYIMVTDSRGLKSLQMVRLFGNVVNINKVIKIIARLNVQPKIF